MSLWKSLGLQDHSRRRLVGEEERVDRDRQTQTEMGPLLGGSRPKPFKLPHFFSFMAATNVAG